MSTQKILDNITNSALRVQVFKSLKDLNSLMSKLNVSSDYKTQALIDALTDHPLNLDVDEPVDPNTKIKKFLERGHKTDQLKPSEQIKIYVDNVVKQYLTNDQINVDLVNMFLQQQSAENGRGLGIVLTPPYVSDMMAKLAKVDEDSTVLDPACGAGSLLMGAGHNNANKLIGIEYQLKLSKLARTNLSDFSNSTAEVIKGDCFDELNKIGKVDRAIINPPYSYDEKGMPFIKSAVDHVKDGGYAVAIIQESALMNKAQESIKQILSKATLLASISMPVSLFAPAASVQTSIILFKVGKPHNFKTDKVKFIKVNNDGYYRSKRGLAVKGQPDAIYSDIPLLVQYGKDAVKHSEFHKELWDFNNQFNEETINESGTNLDFNSHYHPDLTPKEEDFEKVVGDYMEFELHQIFEQVKREGLKKEGE